jgi:threonine dehydrogenase-like Zn-dependent dehydrogenase
MKTEAVYISKGVAKNIKININKLRPDEVLIKTKACGICMGDIYTFKGNLPGGDIMGHEGVGVVVEVGKNVKYIDEGDYVTTLGGPAFAEYHKADYHNVAKIPKKIKDFAIWISEPAACVVNGIRGSKIEIGDSVCIIGCGYMGLLLIQALPKGMVNKLIALDILDTRLVFAKRFGAEFVLNPLNCKVEKEIQDIVGTKMDVVIEASGALGTLRLATDLVRSGGKIVIFGRHVIDENVPTEKWHIKGLNILNTSPSSSLNFNKDFHDAVNLLKKGIFDQRTLITHRFSFNDPEKAFRIASKKPLEYIKGVITF